MGKFAWYLVGVIVLGTITATELPSAAAGLPDGLTVGYDGADVGAYPGTISLTNWHRPNSIITFDETDGNGPQGSKVLSWYHDGSKDDVEYVYGVMRFPTGDGRILHYNLTSQKTNNGYMLMARQNVPDLVQVMDGNRNYVQQHARWGTLKTRFSDPWEVGNIPQLIALCGGSIDYIGGDPDHAFLAGSDGLTALPAFKVTPTPPPRSRIEVGSTYTVGDKIPVHLHSEVYAAATAWHESAVRVYGQDGQYNRYFAINGHPAAHGITWDGGGLVAIAGGGSGDPDHPNVYDEVATLDTTGMAAGTYTVEYTLFDNVDRPSASSTDGSGSVTKQITLQPAPVPPASGGGGGAGVGGTTGEEPPSPGPGKNPVLIQEFEREKPIMLNQWGTEGWKVTNNASVPVTTTLTATLDTYVDLPFEYTYQSGWKSVKVGVDPDGNPIYEQKPVYETVTRYAMHKVRESETKTFTVPAKGSVRWDIGQEMVCEIEGGTTVTGMGLSPFGPWVPDGGTIPGSGAPDTAANNNGHVAESSQVGVNNGKMWLPRLTVTAHDIDNYFSPVISEPIVTVPFDIKGPVPPVISK